MAPSLSAANVKTGEIFHATFPDRGPDEDMRSARVLAGAKVSNDFYKRMRKGTRLQGKKSSVKDLQSKR